MFNSRQETGDEMIYLEPGTFRLWLDDLDITDYVVGDISLSEDNHALSTF